MYYAMNDSTKSIGFVSWYLCLFKRTHGGRFKYLKVDEL